ncbi:MAG TPA: alpha/beta hydrolase [Streptosporangiaceae bacterium]|nr:alpha/beta hydrolase [Streptosporangiaceae bacterium]
MTRPAEARAVPTRLISEPGFAAETAAFLDRLGPAAPVTDYDTLVAARAEPPDPELALQSDPAVHAAGLYLPLRGGPVPARVCQPEPAGMRRPVLLWLHGGGFIGGADRDIAYVTSSLARLAGMTVVSLDYRLAPEHPFPAALHDTLDAICWLASHGVLIGGDGRVVAGGQSAGAALVAGACLLARDTDGPAVQRQVLVYPLLDFGQDTESAREFDGVFHSIRPGGWAEAQYLAGQPVTGYAAPLRAASLAGLPPALVIGAGRDPLRDDARAYAARLAGAGTEASHVEYAGTMHAFLNFCGVLSAGRHAVELIAADLRQALAIAPGASRGHRAAEPPGGPGLIAGGQASR